MNEASFGPDGSCRIAEPFLPGGRTVDEVVWPSVAEWARAWFADWATNTYAAAAEFIADACLHATDGVVDALVMLAETAAGDEELLIAVGAGPLEDLLSHSGNGSQVLADVDRSARQNVAFRAALCSVWLGPEAPAAVRTRLVELGATDLAAGRDGAQ